MTTALRYTATEIAGWAADVVSEYDKQHGLREAMTIVGVPDQAADAVLAVCHEIIERTED